MRSRRSKPRSSTRLPPDMTTVRRGIGARSDYWLSTKYGITSAQFYNLLRAQEGKCQICKTPIVDEDDEPLKSCHVDHCHETGKVRGLLCHNCNVGLGNFKDSPELLRQAALYLEG